MCRLALQLLGMLGNVLGRPRHALQGPWPTSACFCKVLRVPHQRNPPPPHLLPYKLWSQGSSVSWNFIYGSLVVHYSLGFTAYKATSGGGGFLFDVGLLRPCRSMPRSAKDLAKHAKDLAKHAEDVAKYAKVGWGRCQACLGVAK